ncbi:hypothetical protein CHS0354_032493 [Potamilus streckersoni]|uniref:Uncharacterized protein n=1 Tax=Potamilus streckersoni TaxID=2493646 RepID=A0AAE0SQ44_9BIVA|nr:hypothetical protein CHS0354_032493 [Potamilus streckersoni]
MINACTTSTLADELLFRCEHFEQWMWVGMSCVRSDEMHIDMNWPIIGGERSVCHCTQKIVQVEHAFTINATFNVDTYNPELWIGTIISQDYNGRWYCVRNLYTEHPPLPIILLLHVSHAGTEPLSGLCYWNLDNDNFCYSGISETTSLITPSKSSLDQETTTSLEISISPTQSQCDTLTLYDTSTIFLEASHSSHYSLVTFERATIPSSDVLESASLNTTGRECQCLWQCPTSSDSQQEASKLLEKIISDMVIPRNSTSSARRRKTCAPDERFSSKGIGYVGVLVMTIVFGTIVVADLKKIFDNLTFAYENFRRLAIIGYSVKKFKSLKSIKRR